MKTKVKAIEKVGECLAFASCAALVVSLLLGATEMIAGGTAVTGMLVSVLAGAAGCWMATFGN